MNSIRTTRCFDTFLDHLDGGDCVIEKGKSGYIVDGN